ncbi:cytochrome P450 [Streptomyces sp. NPDC088554]|uniref:cytochrome P450 n=1 Tax=Streptomyces sp. NPDC088554 TaxID=3365865 RepID=UPI00382B7C52
MNGPATCPLRSAHSGTGTEPPALSAVTSSADPGAVYRELREKRGSVARVELEPGVFAWLVMGYRELLAVTRQERLFSRDSRNWHDLNDGVVPPHSELLRMMSWRANVVGADGPEHRRLRAPLDEGIAGIDQRGTRLRVGAVCTELIEDLAGRGRADLVNEYALIVPMLALASLFGMDDQEGRELRNALEALSALFSDTGDAAVGRRHFEQILLDTLRARERAPADDLTTAFLRHPNLESETERVQSMAAMIMAGNESIAAWIAHTLRLMLTDARFAAQVHGGRLGVDDALDEALWRDPPMSNMPARFARRDTELGGQTIRRGDVLILGIAAAHDDPAVRPDDSVEGLGNRAHLAFSAGPHACPARVPARLITRTAVNTVLHLLPDMKLTVPAGDLVWRPSPWARIPVALPVEFSTAGIPRAPARH